ncbi:MAG: MFS transporter [Geminicoccaceae bacterium]
MLKYYGAVVAVVAGATLIQLANSFYSVLLPLALAERGASGFLAGLVASAFGGGFFVGCFYTERLIRAVGHIRAFAALASIASILGLLFSMTNLAAVWILLRLVTGFCYAGLSTAIEGWLAAATPSAVRGGVLAFYLVGNRVASILGQQLLGHVTAAMNTWFVLGGAAYAAAVVPVALNRTHAPPPPTGNRIRLLALARIAPAAVAGCIATGLVNSALAGLLPVWGTRLGLSTATIVTFLSLTHVGGMCLQWPIGRLSDGIDRRLVLAGTAGALALVSTVVILAEGGPHWLLGIAFLLWGGCAMSFYAVSVAHAGDLVQPEQMVGVASGCLLVWSAGSMLGPLLAAPLLDHVGPSGLFLFLAGISASLAVFVLWRRTQRSAGTPPLHAALADGLTSPAGSSSLPGNQGERP